MSNLNQDAQPNKPLGDGNKAGTISENRILYALLFVLVGVFFWKVSSDDFTTKIIVENNPNTINAQYEEVTNTANADVNVDVEIMDADLLATTKSTASLKKDNKTKSDIPEKTRINPDFYKSYNLKQMPISNGDGYNNISIYDYNYIFAGDISIPEGTFSGFDEGGFAVLMEKKRSRSLIGGMAQVTLTDEFYPKNGSEIILQNQPYNNNTTTSSAASNSYVNNIPEYSNIVVPNSVKTYEAPIIQEKKKKVVVNRKIKDIPDARDLEPNIPASILGDRDTRTGYGVVIRPKK